MSDDVLQIELVAADRVVWSGQAAQIIARTVDGDVGVLPNHAPMLSLLRAGVVEITAPEGHVVLAAVEEGFLSVADNRVSILSDDAFLADEIDPSAARAELDRLRDGDDEVALRWAEAKMRVLEKNS